MASALRSSRLGSLARSVAVASARPAFTPSSSSLVALRASRFYSTEKSAEEGAKAEEGKAEKSEAEVKVAELETQLEAKSKTIAELKDSRLRTLADFENLQKISTREKQQAKDFALTSFSKDLIGSIDVLSLAIKSVPSDKITTTPEYTPNSDLVQLHEGLTLTKKSIEKVLERHGVVAFDPTGEQFDPNRHEALYQAPVPGKEPGSVLEVQEIGYMIKDRLLRPAKVGVVLATE